MAVRLASRRVSTGRAALTSTEQISGKRGGSGGCDHGVAENKRAPSSRMSAWWWDMESFFFFFFSWFPVCILLHTESFIMRWPLGSENIAGGLSSWSTLNAGVH